MFTFEHVSFRYDPYPIGLIKPIMDQHAYDALVRAFPPVELFKFMPKFGNKYVLSEKFNPEQYHDYVAQTPCWRELHRWIKSREFLRSVLAMLRAHGIETGLRDDAGTTWRRVKVFWRDLKRRRWPMREVELRARFEFSALPADGGYILPHTDNPSKYITLVVSMLREDEWDPSFGGGTDVNRPRDERRNFNFLNEQMKFEDVEVIDTFEFTPNQSVIFVKTFNSLHSVRPMTGRGSRAMRRTFTINIEADQ